MGHDIEQTVTIDRPPAHVWRWTVEDTDREQRWRNLDGTGVQEVRRLDDGPVDVGSRFRGSVKVGPGQPDWYTNEVTALEEHRLISWETVDADGPLGGGGSYRLEPLDGGSRTRFTIQLDYEPLSLAGRIQGPVVALVGRLYFIPRLLEKLKRLVEGDPELQ